MISHSQTTDNEQILSEQIMQLEDLQVLTLVGPPRDNLEPDSLAVLHPDNRLYISERLLNEF